MLKQLLKYEFKATKSLYFGLYLALALLSVVLGVTFRQEHALAHSTSFQNLEVILMIVYVSVILAIAVLCFVNTIQRFYKNLLGREGYLMHTLPVTETQLILSKLLTSMVWVLCSGLVGIVCITGMVSIGVLDAEVLGTENWDRWMQLCGMLYGELGAKFWLVTFWTILINLARLVSLILCVYAACMIAHQFPKHVMVAGILAFIGLNIVETQLDKLLGTNDVSMIGGCHVPGRGCERDRCELWSDPDALADGGTWNRRWLSVLLCRDCSHCGGILLPDPVADEK